MEPEKYIITAPEKQYTLIGTVFVHPDDLPEIMFGSQLYHVLLATYLTVPSEPKDII